MTAPNAWNCLRISIAVSALLLLGPIACGGGDESNSVAETTPASATPIPPDAAAAEAVFHEFVEKVAAGDVPKAWALYAASITGTIDEYRQEMGCPFTAFQSEFPKIQHLFAKEAPFEVTESFGASPGSTVIELRLRAPSGAEYLGTLQRVEANETYRIRFLNSGQVAVIPGQPDPLPSPEFPEGFCGIWTGPR